MPSHRKNWFSYYYNKARDIPLRLLIAKIFRRLLSAVVSNGERFGWRITRAITRQPPFNYAQFGEIFKDGFVSRLPINVQTHRERYIKYYEDKISDRTEIIAQADKICSHYFDMLGSGSIFVGNPIRWRTDFKSGYTWKKKYFKTLFVYNPWDNSDVKVPWELSRFQHLPTLGKAYWLTKDEKYAREFVSQIEDWVEENPLRYGVNWKCAMDVAIRAVNWIYGYGFFLDSPSLGDDFRRKFFCSLFEHGDFIFPHLEYHSVHRGNHYLANLVGLIYLGAFFKKTPQGKEWLKFASKELLAEMSYQVYSDGVNHEMSTSYHRLVLELFLFGAVVASRAEYQSSENFLFSPAEDRTNTEKIFGKDFLETLKKMFDFIYYVTRPDGRIPLIGDHDDGRLHILSGYGSWAKDDARHLLALGGALFENPDWQNASNEQGSEEAWWLWPEHFAVNIKRCAQKNPSSRAFREGGFYIMRENNDYLITRCGPVGIKGGGSHDHCDHLSVEICLDGTPIVIDPGCYVYTADPTLRSLFRSTAYHNTISVDGAEQNSFDKINLFNMTERTKSLCLRWEVGEKFDYFEGIHRGFEHLEKNLIHKRKIWFDKLQKMFYIRDELNSEKTRRYEWRFHLAPNCAVTNTYQKRSADSFAVSEAVKNCLELYGFQIKTENREWMLWTSIKDLKVEDGWISRSYGVREKGEILCGSVISTDVGAIFILTATVG